MWPLFLFSLTPPRTVPTFKVFKGIFFPIGLLSWNSSPLHVRVLPHASRELSPGLWEMVVHLWHNWWARGSSEPRGSGVWPLPHMQPQPDSAASPFSPERQLVTTSLHILSAPADTQPVRQPKAPSHPTANVHVCSC